MRFFQETFPTGALLHFHSTETECFLAVTDHQHKPLKEFKLCFSVPGPPDGPETEITASKMDQIDCTLAAIENEAGVKIVPTDTQLDWLQVYRVKDRVS